VIQCKKIAAWKLKMSKRTALIIIGRYKEEWQPLSPEQKSDLIARVGRTLSALELAPVTGYRLTTTPGAFIEIWEADDARAIERAIKNLQALGYTRYVEARWMIGERAAQPAARGDGGQ
jgi:hypothetical protein